MPGASTVAASGEQMLLWMGGLRVFLVGTTDPPFSSNSTFLADFEKSRFKTWPSALRDVKRTDPILCLYKNVKGFEDGMSSFFDAVGKRCALAPGTAIDAVGDNPEDPCRLFLLFQVLVSHFAVILRSQGKNEATHRSRVDAIIEDVFVVDKCYEIEYVRFHSILSHLNLCYAYMHDAEICVHRSSTLHVTSAKIDIAVLHTIEDSSLRKQVTGPEVHRFFWQHHPPTGLKSYISFVVEHEPTVTQIDSERKLVFDLITVLSQRAALLMPKIPVYGATCNGGKFSLFEAVSNYEGRQEKHEVIFLKSWNLYQFGELLDVVCLLHFIREYTETDFRKYSSSTVDLMSSDLPSWRADAADNPKPKETGDDESQDSGASLKGSRGGRSGSHGGSGGGGPGGNSCVADESDGPRGVKRSRRDQDQDRASIPPPGASINLTCGSSFVEQYLASLVTDKPLDTGALDAMDIEQSLEEDPTRLDDDVDIDELELLRSLPCDIQQGRALLRSLHERMPGQSFSAQIDDKHPHPMYITLSNDDGDK